MGAINAQDAEQAMLDASLTSREVTALVKNPVQCLPQQGQHLDLQPAGLILLKNTSPVQIAVALIRCQSRF